MTEITLQKATEKLAAVHQEHLLDHWNSLPNVSQDRLLKQITCLNLNLYKEQQNSLQQVQKSPSNIQPFHDYSISGNKEDQQIGKKLISSGKVGCLIIAGGQATRLQFSGPKGLFPITPITKKTLFQLFAEKIAAASDQIKKRLPVAIMTSPLNHQVTVDYFHEHNFFGLDPSQLSFFTQKMLPFLDVNGNLFLENSDSIAEGPDGNGFSLRYFYEQGIWKKWRDQGVEQVIYILIDNPLADPFDAELVGFHSRQKADVTLKCTARKSPDENVGLIVKENNQIRVIEYTEMKEEDKTALLPNGSLKYVCANISLFCFSMEFIEKVSQRTLPLHKAQKSLNSLSSEKAWKFETFIFDVLSYANRIEALMYPRERCFAPLKSLNAQGSVAEVQEALTQEAKRVFSEVTGKQAPEGPFELPIRMYYRD